MKNWFISVFLYYINIFQIGVFNQIFGEVTSLLVLNTKVLVCYDSGEIRLFPYPCWEKEVRMWERTINIINFNYHRWNQNL